MWGLWWGWFSEPQIILILVIGPVPPLCESGTARPAYAPVQRLADY